MKRRDFVLGAASLSAAGCAAGPGGAGSAVARGSGSGGERGPGPSAALAAARERYFLTSLALTPVTSTYLGGDGYSPLLRGVNGRLKDYSASSRRAERHFLTSVQGELASIAADRLRAAERTDHAVIAAQVAFQLRQLGAGADLRAVDAYVAEPFRGVDWQIQQMTEIAGSGSLGEGTTGGAPPALLGTEAEWQDLVARVGAVPDYLSVAADRLTEGVKEGIVPDRRMVERDGLQGGASNAEFFRSGLLDAATRHLGGRPFAEATLEQLRVVGAAAAEAFERFRARLKRLYPMDERVDRFAAGEGEYAWRVRHCLLDARSPAELWAFGGEQVAASEERVFEAAARVARDARMKLPFATDADKRRSTREVLTFLEREAPKDDEELFRWYRQAGERAVAYGREQGLFDVPASYRLDVVETPPVLRSTTDAAYYPAPPFKPSGFGRFYLTPTGNDPALLRVNFRASIANTAVHEGFPGHDWHYKFMTANRAEISPVRWFTPGSVEDSLSMWQDSMTTEGWALYAEELMAEPAAGRPHGFYDAAELLSMLQWQLVRAVRVRVDVGIHTGRMTFDEAVDYFAQHVSFLPAGCASVGAAGSGADEESARAACAYAQQAIYRYSKWPTQAITYLLGKDGIVSLKEELRARHRTAFSARAFHEALMRKGTIPLGYFREQLLAELAP